MGNRIENIVTEFGSNFINRTFNEILGCAKYSIDGLSLVRDVDEFNDEIACEVMFKGINFKVEVYREFGKNKVCFTAQVTPRLYWETAAENAICLWATTCEECFVEINPNYIKFFKSEYDKFFACYDYPSLSTMKKDSVFRKCIKDCLEEANMLTKEMEKELSVWFNDVVDLPPFPLSVILHSDYPTYKFIEWE